MGKVTISSDEYRKLIQGRSDHHGKKGKKGSNRENQIMQEIKNLQDKKTEISKRLAEAKQGKGFLKRTGISIGAAGRVMQINKEINEKKQILGLLRRKEGLKVQKEVSQLQKEVFVDKQDVRAMQEKERKKLTEEIFDMDDIFGY